MVARVGQLIRTWTLADQDQDLWEEGLPVWVAAAGVELSNLALDLSKFPGCWSSSLASLSKFHRAWQVRQQMSLGLRLIPVKGTMTFGRRDSQSGRSMMRCQDGGTVG